MYRPIYKKLIMLIYRPTHKKAINNNCVKIAFPQVEPKMATALLYVRSSIEGLDQSLTIATVCWMAPSSLLQISCNEY